MTRCLILGRSGQLGMALASTAWPSGWFPTFLDRQECDFTNLAEIPVRLKAYQPELIINAAAYTSVDKAEQEKDFADLVNHQAVKVVGEFARQCDIPIVHFSTDYVFDGRLDRPYREDDLPAPLNIYGLSKWRGEQALLQSQAKCTILRTSWVFFEKGSNFVLKMLSLAERQELTIVDDQIGAPTYARDLARATQKICSLIMEKNPKALGLFHLTAKGETSWFDCAQEIFRIAKEYKISLPKLKAIHSAAYPSAAKRPANSRLDCRKIAADCQITLPDWRDGLQRCLVAYLGRQI